MTDGVAHPGIVRAAGELFKERVASARHGDETNLSANARQALEALEESLEAALTKGTATTDEDVTFTWQLMRRVPIAEADWFINEYQLGYGRDDAPVVAVGTEHAYQLLVHNTDGSRREEGLTELTMECANPIFWLTKSPQAVVRKIGDVPWWKLKWQLGAQYPYHIYPAVYHMSGSMGTWACIGRTVLGGGALWRQVLGERCYQIELSAFPAARSSEGRSASPIRLDFLNELMRALRTTARVLLFHGTPKFSASDPRDGLARIFLETDSLPPATVGHDSKHRTWRCHQAGERRAIFSYALNGRAVDNEYMTTIAGLIEDVARPSVRV